MVSSSLSSCDSRRTVLHKMPLVEKHIEFHPLVIRNKYQLDVLFNDSQLLLEQFALKFEVTALKECSAPTSEDEDMADGDGDDNDEDDNGDEYLPRCKCFRVQHSTSEKCPVQGSSISTPATSDKATQTGENE